MSFLVTGESLCRGDHAPRLKEIHMRRRSADGTVLREHEWERAPGDVRSLSWLLGEPEPEDHPHAAPVRERKAHWWGLRNQHRASRS